MKNQIFTLLLGFSATFAGSATADVICVDQSQTSEIRIGLQNGQCSGLGHSSLVSLKNPGGFQEFCASKENIAGVLMSQDIYQLFTPDGFPQGKLTLATQFKFCGRVECPPHDTEVTAELEQNNEITSYTCSAD